MTQSRSRTAFGDRSRPARPSAADHDVAALLPFVERRSSARLRATHLRRRMTCRTAAALDRRRPLKTAADIATTLERQLDVYPTRAAMLTYLSSLTFAAESNSAGVAHAEYRRALERAATVVRNASETRDAVATLHGYQAFMALHQVSDAD